MDRKKTIGISFSGGGARASAHIGVIKALQEHGISADFVSGASSGSIIGTLYAAGLSVEEMQTFANQNSLFRLFDVGLPITGLTSLNKLGELLQEFIKVERFEDLSIPLFVSVANLMRAKKQIISTGPIFSAIMASCAIPFIFKPVEINDEVYADGGIYDNMPVETIRPFADVTIGINVMPKNRVGKEELDNVFSIGRRIFDMYVIDSSRQHYPICDVIIEPREVLNYSIFDFRSTDELIEIGYQEGLKVIDAIKKHSTE